MVQEVLSCVLSHLTNHHASSQGCAFAGKQPHLQLIQSPLLTLTHLQHNLQQTIMLDIHATVLEHGARLARRGLDMTVQNQPGGEAVSVEIPSAAIAIFATLGVFFVLALSSVRYTLQGVIATMAMVEEPSTAILVSEKPTFSEKEDVTAPLLLADLETVAVTSQPVTSSIRTSMHHILQAGGWTARWRGLGIFLLWAIPSTILRKVWMTLLSGEDAGFIDLGMPAAHVLSSLIAGVSMMKLHMFWTRKVLTVPGTKTYWHDQTPRKTFSALFLPTVITTLAWEATIGLPITLAYALGVVGTSADGMHAFIGSQDGQAHCDMIVKMVLIGLIGIGAFFGVFIPSHVALIRVEASLIPVDAETIVPFDRTFGGRVISESEGGSGQLNYVQAWSSFTSAQRVRLLRLVGKIFAVEVALHMVFGFFAASLALAFLRPDVFARVGRTHV